MPNFDAKLIFTILGPVFVVLGIVRCLAAGRMHPQGRIWLLVGVIFSAVAVWLWWHLG